MSEGPVFTQRKGGGAAVNEVTVRKPGQWGVAIDFSRSIEQNNPLLPMFIESELPPEVIVPGSKRYLMVHARFTFVDCDPVARRWIVQAEVYPRFKTADALRKLQQRLPEFKAWLAELASHPTLPPLVGSEVTVIRYLRKDFPPTEMAENTLTLFDRSAGLRAARAEQVVRQENALREARERATQPWTEKIAPDWPWLEQWPFFKRLLTRTVVHPPPLFPEVVPDEEPIVVPEVDEWMNIFLDLAGSPRVAGVERGLDSLYSILVLEQEGGREHLLKAGIGGLHFQKTRIVNPDAPISAQLWGMAGNTIVQPDRPAIPPVQLR